MRLQTAVAIVLVVGLFGGLAFTAIGGTQAGGGTLTEEWVSDTPRDNQVNHHAIGVGPDRRTIVAPASEAAGDNLPETACSHVRLAPGSGAVQWRESIPPEDCYTHGLTQPAIADVDGDGALEVLAVTTANDTTLVAYEAETGKQLFAVSMPSYAGYGQPTVANLTADPGPEIVAADIQGNVVAVDGDGTVLWRQSLSGATYAPPLVDDIDSDGTPEVVIGTRNGTVVLTPEGEIDRQSPVAASTLVHDGGDEEAADLFVTNSRRVVSLNAEELTVNWERSFETIPRVRAIGDVNGDGEAELLVSLSAQRVVALSAETNEIQWETQVGSEESRIMPAARIADVSGDGTPEVIAVTNSGTVAVLDAETGAELAAYDRDVPVWTTPSVADIDGNGDLEILVRYGDGRVVALDYR